MQTIVAIFFLVFDFTTCEPTQATAVTNQHDQHRFNSSCQKIKCPTNNAPICVKMKYPTETTNKTMYIVMINKCEMEYVNCYKGIQAAEIPMKNCDHKKVHEKRRLKRNLPNEGRRLEISVKRKGNKNVHKTLIIKSNKNVELGAKNKNNKNRPKKQRFKPLKMKTHMKKMAGADTHGTEDVSPENPKLVGAPNNDDDSKSVEHSMTARKLKNEGLQIYELEDMDSKQHVQDEDLNEDNSEGEERQSGGNEDVGANDNYKDDGVDREVDAYGIDDKVDKEQYNAECPTACPSRDVMLCARCIHGVYRTFPSVCHMRVFSCKQPEEKLELVSRKPCVLSAPYLNDVAVPKGRVSEPDDEDPVLRYYRCKQKLAKLGKALTDPDCLSLKLKAKVTELSETEEQV